MTPRSLVIWSRRAGGFVVDNRAILDTLSLMRTLTYRDHEALLRLAEAAAIPFPCQPQGLEKIPLEVLEEARQRLVAGLDGLLAESRSLQS